MDFDWYVGFDVVEAGTMYEGGDILEGELLGGESADHVLCGV